MWRKILFGTVVGMMAVFAIIVTGSIHAQGDWKPISRVQEDQWCTSHGFASVTAKDEHPQTVNSFPYCKGNDGNLYKVDMIQLCRDLYGDAYANPQYWDYNNYDSWYCNHVNTVPPTPVPPQPTPVPQQQQPSGGNTGGNQGSGGSSQPQQPSGGGMSSTQFSKRHVRGLLT